MMNNESEFASVEPGLMGIKYSDENMEGVRLVAREHIQKIQKDSIPIKDVQLLLDELKNEIRKETKCDKEGSTETFDDGIAFGGAIALTKINIIFSKISGGNQDG